MVDKKEEPKKRRSRSKSSSSSSGSSSSGSSGSSRSSSSSSSSRSPSPRNKRESGKTAPVVRGRSRSPRRSPVRGARVDRGDRPIRRSPSPRRRRSPSPRRRDRSGSRGRRGRSPRRSSPRKSSPVRRVSPRKVSPSRRISVRNLSRNVNKEHLAEIFSMYGTIKTCELPSDRMHAHLHRGYGYIEYEKAEDTEKAIKYMDGGQIDGQAVNVELTLNRTLAGGRRSSPVPVRRSPVRKSSPVRRSPVRRRSPPPRGGGGPARTGANDVPLGTRTFNRHSRSRSPVQRRRRSRS